jgi:ceramide glucosyltransferase
MVILSLLLALLVIAGSAYSLLSLFCVLAFFRKGEGEKRPSLGDDLPGVSILKPIKGIDPSCAENLASFCAQDYPRYEVLFGFRETDDPAIPLVRSMVDAAACDARIIVKREGAGSNEKVLNLAALAAASQYPILALSDSDMVADRDYLGRIVAEFRGGAHTGIVTSLYKISNPSSLGSALESLAIALDFIPSVLVARRLEGITFGLGASILVSKKALTDIGGLETVADYLADDYQLGFRLWRKGYRNILSRHVIENRVGPMTIAAHLVHQLRWARTYRASRPKGFIGYGVTHILPFALLLVCIAPTPASACLLGVVLALRYALALVVQRKVIAAAEWRKWLLLLPLRDIIALFIWLLSFAGSTVTWRGRAYRIIGGGRMVKL